MACPTKSPAYNGYHRHDDRENIMAGQTREPQGAANAGALSPAEVADTADTSPRAPAADTSGRRVRAIPAVITKSGDTASRVEVRRSDFANQGIDHAGVIFDFKKDRFTLPVGPNGLSEQAAEFLTKNYPTSFEYLGG